MTPEAALAEVYSYCIVGVAFFAAMLSAGAELYRGRLTRGWLDALWSAGMTFTAVIAIITYAGLIIAGLVWALVK